MSGAERKMGANDSREMGVMMKSKTAIAGRSIGGGHVILRAYSNDELRVVPKNVTPKTFNDFILARNLDQLMSAIESLGVMSCEKDKDTLEVFDEDERVLSVKDVRKRFDVGELLGLDYSQLVDDDARLDVYEGKINKNALKRLCERYDAKRNGFIEQLSEFDDDDMVSVEPIQDWVDLHNNIVHTASVKGFTTISIKEGRELNDGSADFLKWAMWVWMNPRVDEDSALAADGIARLRVDTLDTALWKMVFFPEDHEIAICKYCGNAFLRSKKGRMRIWCKDSCRVQYSAKGGSKIWLPVTTSK